MLKSPVKSAAEYAFALFERGAKRTGGQELPPAARRNRKVRIKQLSREELRAFAQQVPEYAYLTDQDMEWLREQLIAHI